MQSTIKDSTSTNYTNMKPNKISYAEKTKITPIVEFQHPTEEQGLVFNCILDYKIRDYLVALKEVIKDPKNIIAASKVSKNRIIIHLKNKEQVDEFFQNGGSFKIEEKLVKCRRLTTPLKKIVLSHVNPIIPNELLEEYVKNVLKMELSTKIAYLRLNPLDQVFGHIISWRRQFYTTTDFDKDKIDGSFLISYNDQNHRIFLTCDEFSCFKCHKRGHRAEECPNEEFVSEDEDDNLNNEVEINKSDTIQENTSAVKIFPHSTKSLNSDEFPLLQLDTSKSKRPLSITSTTTEKSANSNIPTRPTKKKRKSSKNKSNNEEDSHSEVDDEQMNQTNDTSSQTPQLSLKEIFAPLQKHVEKNSLKYPISLQNLSLFVDMCQGPNAQNASQVMDDLSITNENDLIIMLKETHDLIQHRSTKIKFTKIIKRLEDIQKSKSRQDGQL